MHIQLVYKYTTHFFYLWVIFYEYTLLVFHNFLEDYFFSFDLKHMLSAMDQTGRLRLELNKPNPLGLDK